MKRTHQDYSLGPNQSGIGPSSAKLTKIGKVDSPSFAVHSPRGSKVRVFIGTVSIKTGSGLGTRLLDKL